MIKNEITILSTRPLEAAINEKAGALNIRIDMVSFIETTPIQTNTVKEQIIQSLARPATVVFTSMNAVEVVATGANGQQPAWDIFCIGATTRELAATHFGASSIAGTADNALALAEVIITTGKKEQPVIFFCGDQRRDELPARLKQQHIPVVEVVVYTTIATPVKIEKEYNGILFFSPSAVHSFFSVNILTPKTVLFAIGETTANSIRTYTSNEIIAGDTPGKNSLAELAIDHFTS
jgi:uroporphyrinogen-III synthase